MRVHHSRSTKTGPRRNAPTGGATPTGDGSATDRVDLYAEVTARIIGELEAGRVPWVQPWERSGVPVPGMPRNALTARCYSGNRVGTADSVVTDPDAFDGDRRVAA